VILSVYISIRRVLSSIESSGALMSTLLPWMRHIEIGLEWGVVLPEQLHEFIGILFDWTLAEWFPLLKIMHRAHTLFACFSRSLRLVPVASLLVRPLTNCLPRPSLREPTRIHLCPGPHTIPVSQSGDSFILVSGLQRVYGVHEGYDWILNPRARTQPPHCWRSKRWCVLAAGP